MSNVVPIQNDQERRRQATEWIARMERGLSTLEIDELRAWIRADIRNEQELQECARLWDMLGALQSLGDMIPHEKRKFSWRPLPLVASFVLALITGLIALVSFFQISPSRNRFSLSLIIRQPTQRRLETRRRYI